MDKQSQTENSDQVIVQNESMHSSIQEEDRLGSAVQRLCTLMQKQRNALQRLDNPTQDQINAIQELDRIQNAIQRLDNAIQDQKDAFRGLDNAIQGLDNAFHNRCSCTCM